MATVHLDDALYRRLQASAEARGSSAEAEVARLVDANTPRERTPADQAELDAVLDRVRALHRRMEQEFGGPLPSGSALIRQMRDEE